MKRKILKSGKSFISFVLIAMLMFSLFSMNVTAAKIQQAESGASQTIEDTGANKDIESVGAISQWNFELTDSSGKFIGNKQINGNSGSCTLEGLNAYAGQTVKLSKVAAQEGGEIKQGFNDSSITLGTRYELKWGKEDNMPMDITLPANTTSLTFTLDVDNGKNYLTITANTSVTATSYYIVGSMVGATKDSDWYNSNKDHQMEHDSVNNLYYYTVTDKTGDQYFRMHNGTTVYGGTGNSNVDLAKDTHTTLTEYGNSGGAYHISEATSRFTVFTDGEYIWYSDGSYTPSTNYTVTYGVNNSSYGSVSCAKTADSTNVESGTSVASGTEVKFTASPKTGYEVAGWYSDSACNNAISGAGTSPTYTTTVNSATTVYVKFQATSTPSATYTLQGRISFSTDNAWQTDTSKGLTLTKDSSTEFYKYATGKSVAELSGTASGDKPYFMYVAEKSGSTETKYGSSGTTGHKFQDNTAGNKLQLSAITGTGEDVLIRFNDTNAKDATNVVIWFDATNKKLWYTSDAPIPTTNGYSVDIGGNTHDFYYSSSKGKWLISATVTVAQDAEYIPFTFKSTTDDVTTVLTANGYWLAGETSTTKTMSEATESGDKFYVGSPISAGSETTIYFMYDPVAQTLNTTLERTTNKLYADLVDNSEFAPYLNCLNGSYATNFKIDNYLEASYTDSDSKNVTVKMAYDTANVFGRQKGIFVGNFPDSVFETSKIKFTLKKADGTELKSTYATDQSGANIIPTKAGQIYTVDTGKGNVTAWNSYATYEAGTETRTEATLYDLGINLADKGTKGTDAEGKETYSKMGKSQYIFFDNSTTKWEQVYFNVWGENLPSGKSDTRYPMTKIVTDDVDREFQIDNYGHALDVSDLWVMDVSDIFSGDSDAAITWLGKVFSASGDGFLFIDRGLQKTFPQNYAYSVDIADCTVKTYDPATSTSGTKELKFSETYNNEYYPCFLSQGYIDCTKRISDDDPKDFKYRAYTNEFYDLLQEKTETNIRLASVTVYVDMHKTPTNVYMDIASKCGNTFNFSDITNRPLQRLGTSTVYSATFQLPFDYDAVDAGLSQYASPMFTFSQITADSKDYTLASKAQPTGKCAKDDYGTGEVWLEATDLVATNAKSVNIVPTGGAKNILPTGNTLEDILFAKSKLASKVIESIGANVDVKESGTAPSTVYFKNRNNTDTVYVHYWGGSSETQWDNTTMNCVDSTNNIYVYEGVDTGSSGIIFHIVGSDGKSVNQSDDLSPSSNNNYFKPSGYNTEKFNGAWSNLYKVSFDANGHGTAPSSQYVESGSNASDPGDLSETGYTFGGWYETSDCSGTQVSFPYAVTRDVTLYAKWTENSSSSTKKKVYFRNTANWSNVYIYCWKDGSGNNAGWPGETMTPVEGTTNVYSYEISEDADWNKCIFNSGNNGTQTKNLTLHTNTKIYVFDKDGSTGNDTTADTYWQDYAQTYTVTLEPNGGTIASDKDVTSYTYGTGATLPTANDVTKTGYTFSGWYDSEGNQVTEITATDTGNKSYTAHWTPNTYNVTFNSDGGTAVFSITVTYDGEYPPLEEPTKANYTFAGWYLGGTQITTGDKVEITEDSELTAHWTPDSYSVTFEAYGGTVTDSFDTYTYGTAKELPTNVTKAGYDFDGWYDNEELSGTAVSQISATDSGAKTYYAKWTPKTVTVTFDPNYNGAETSIKDVTFGGKYTLPETEPNRTGYTFAGWYTDASAGTQVTTDTDVTNANNHTLYAHWNVDQFTVTASAGDGGTVSPTTTTDDFGKTVTFTATPAEGKKVSAWKVNGVTQSGQSSNTFEYTITAETTQTVSVEFTDKQYKTIYVGMVSHCFNTGDSKVTSPGYKIGTNSIVSLPTNSNDSSYKKVYFQPSGAWSTPQLFYVTKVQVEDSETGTLQLYDGTSSRGSAQNIVDGHYYLLYHYSGNFHVDDLTSSDEYFSFSVDAPTGGTISISNNDGKYGDLYLAKSSKTVTATATADTANGYNFSSWNLTGVSKQSEDGSTVTFNVTQNDAVVSATFTNKQYLIINRPANVKITYKDVEYTVKQEIDITDDTEGTKYVIKLDITDTNYCFKDITITGAEGTVAYTDELTKQNATVTITRGTSSIVVTPTIKSNLGGITVNAYDQNGNALNVFDGVSTKVFSGNIGSSVTLTAPVYSGYNFDGWYDENGKLISKSAKYTVPAQAFMNEMTVKAVYESTTNQYFGVLSYSHSTYNLTSIKGTVNATPSVTTTGGHTGASQSTGVVTKNGDNDYTVYYADVDSETMSTYKATLSAYSAPNDNAYKFSGWLQDGVTMVTGGSTPTLAFVFGDTATGGQTPFDQKNIVAVWVDALYDITIKYNYKEYNGTVVYQENYDLSDSGKNATEIKRTVKNVGYSTFLANISKFATDYAPIVNDVYYDYVFIYDTHTITSAPVGDTNGVITYDAVADYNNTTPQKYSIVAGPNSNAFTVTYYKPDKTTVYANNYGHYNWLARCTASEAVAEDGSKYFIWYTIADNGKVDVFLCTNKQNYFDLRLTGANANKSICLYIDNGDYLFGDKTLKEYAFETNVSVNGNEVTYTNVDTTTYLHFRVDVNCPTNYEIVNMGAIYYYAADSIGTDGSAAKSLPDDFDINMESGSYEVTEAGLIGAVKNGKFGTWHETSDHNAYVKPFNLTDFMNVDNQSILTVSLDNTKYYLYNMVFVGFVTYEDETGAQYTIVSQKYLGSIPTEYYSGNITT